MSEQNPEPEQVVDDAAIDVDDDAAPENDAAPEAEPTPKKRKRAPAVDRPFPRKTLEDALRVPTAIRSHNGGKPYAPGEVAKALGHGMSGNFYYLTAASRDFGLTEGTRDTASISLTDLGRAAVYPTSDEALTQTLLDAFFSVELFREGGGALRRQRASRRRVRAEHP